MGIPDNCLLVTAPLRNLDPEGGQLTGFLRVVHPRLFYQSIPVWRMNVMPMAQFLNFEKCIYENCVSFLYNICLFCYLLIFGN